MIPISRLKNDIVLGFKKGKADKKIPSTLDPFARQKCINVIASSEIF